MNPASSPQRPQHPQRSHHAGALFAAPALEASKQLTLGARGEAVAADFLATLGYRILDRNWHSRYGELDLVVRDGDALVAVEVKTRGGEKFGDPLTAITARKVGRLRRLLFEWVRTHQERSKELRIDAVGITILPGQQPQVDHLRGIS
ncbi:putative endonuclease [Leucobacter luti]|uniref:YraN family protein n=1 Tax=Leucobacter luti TaxID=340320 RepID=UPI00104C6241|nr:YraN family protein [Leucobacter luti]MCW2288123.1 putative endonuclease [Leucobacter luti]TCK45715.1 putative endonuclease [Leucobacter luti]